MTLLLCAYIAYNIEWHSEDLPWGVANGHLSMHRVHHVRFSVKFEMRNEITCVHFIWYQFLSVKTFVVAFTQSDFFWNPIQYSKAMPIFPSTLALSFLVAPLIAQVCREPTATERASSTIANSYNPRIALKAYLENVTTPSQKSAPPFFGASQTNSAKDLPIKLRYVQFCNLNPMN